MRTATFFVGALATLIATSVSAPVPATAVGESLNNIIGSVTNPSAGNGNIFKGNGNSNGNKNGNNNEAGNNNGNENSAGENNSAGNSNSVNLGLGDILKRGTVTDLLGNVVGSITNPSAGNGNRFEGNGQNNGNGNGNGNSAGNNNGNGNSAGNNNSAGNGNSINVGLPDIAVDPTINLRNKIAA